VSTTHPAVNTILAFRTQLQSQYATPTRPISLYSCSSNGSITELTEETLTQMTAEQWSSLFTGRFGPSNKRQVRVDLLISSPNRKVTHYNISQDMKDFLANYNATIGPVPGGKEGIGKEISLWCFHAHPSIVDRDSTSSQLTKQWRATIETDEAAQAKLKQLVQRGDQPVKVPEIVVAMETVLYWRDGRKIKAPALTIRIDPKFVKFSCRSATTASMLQVTYCPKLD